PPSTMRSACPSACRPGPVTRLGNSKHRHRPARMLPFAILFGGANSCMDFGIFSQHHRPGRAVADAYDEDEFEVRTADALGHREVWISEHAFPAEPLICKLAARTEQIRLGPGVRPILSRGWNSGPGPPGRARSPAPRHRT